MAKPKPIVARHLFDFPDVVGDRHVVVVTVGPDLNPIVLSLGKSPDYRSERAGFSFPKREASEPNDFRIHYRVENQWLTVDVQPTAENIHAVQPLGPDHWLLVRGRASRSTDRNAHVADARGRFVHAFHAGDGIEDVQTTADAKIWCSFFDEGVFSDLEMGHAGLICLDSRGRKLFDYAQLAGTPAPIADCYALNVSGNHETWLYYYTNFPLIRLADFQLADNWPRMPVSGSHAFSIAGSRARFFGSYNERQTLFEVNLSNRRVQKFAVTTKAGTPIQPTAAFGRGDHLYLQSERSLYLID